MSVVVPSPQRPLRGVPEPPEAPASVTLAANEIVLVLLLVSSVAVGYAMPFRPVKYAIILLFGVVFLLQTMRRPALGLAMLAFSTPALGLIPPGLIPIRGVNAETILIVAMLFVWYRATQIQGRDTLRTVLGKVLLVYVVMIMLSSINSWMSWRMSLFDTLSQAKNHVSFMLFFPVAFHTLRERRDQMLVFCAGLLAIALSSAEAINTSWFPLVAGTLDRYRAYSIWAPQPNIFGGALALYLPLTIIMAINPIGSKFVRVFLALTSALAGFALLLTLSRGAWLGLAGALVVVSLLKNWRLLLLIGVMGAGYQFWVPEAAIERVEVTTQVGDDLAGDQIADDSTQMRVEQYKSLPAMMAPRPIFGWGYRAYSRVFEMLGTLGRRKGPHSTYCQIGTEEGVIGLIVLGILFVLMASTGIKAYKYATSDFPRWLGVGVFGGTISMALCMASGARFESQVVFGYFWIFAAIAEREALEGLLQAKGQRPRLVDQ